MAKEALNIRKELEKSLEQGKVQFGLKSVMRALKQGLATKVFYATNTPERLKNDLEYYTNLSGAQLVAFPGDSKEIGVALRRTHKIMVAAIVKG